MESRALRFVNCYEELKKSIPQFIEAFVKYYGEDLRSEIETKFNNAFYIGYQSPESINRVINTLEKEKSNELFNIILSGLELDISLKDLTDTTSFNFQNIHPMNSLINLYKLHKLGQDGRKKAFIEKGFEYLKTINPELTEEEYENIFSSKKLPESYSNLPKWKLDNINYYLDDRCIDKEYRDSYEKSKQLINKIMPGTTFKNLSERIESPDFRIILILIDRYLDAIEEYQRFKEENSSLYKEVNDISDRKRKMGQKHHLAFISENIDILPENLRKKVAEELSTKKDQYSFENPVDEIFGYFIKGTSILEAFKEDKNDLTKLGDWQRGETIRKRIKYFQIHCINHGDDYNKYLEDEEVKKIWPSSERIEAFFRSKEKHENAFNNEFYTSSDRYNMVRASIDSVGFLDKEDIFDASTFISNLTAINPNIVFKDNTYSLLPLVLINFDDLDGDCLDHNIVHELNHLFELTLQEVMGDSYSFVCGWDVGEESINQDSKKYVDTFKDEAKREYELFNEIINELITQEICEIMHQNNMHVFDEENKSTFKNTTSYEHYRFLVKNFFEEFKDVIIASRRGNIELLFAEVGKENFEELNSLFEIFYENFGGAKIYRVAQSLAANDDTEETRLFNSLRVRSEEILEKMRIYRDNKNKESLYI